MKVYFQLIKKRSYNYIVYFFIIICILLLFFISRVVSNLPKIPEAISLVTYTFPTRIYDSNEKLIFVLGGYPSIKLDNISNDFLCAIVATEDHNFWNHYGVNKLRTIKAIFYMFLFFDKIQGGSTITQQLAKNFFFGFEKTFTRKICELLVAIQIESQFSKKEILEAYVNQISFGAGIYGIEQASRSFFNKAASDLNLAESSLLAGLPKSPVGYSPYRFPKKAKKRQRTVLKRMLKVGFIDIFQMEEAYNEELNYCLVNKKLSNNNNYFINLVVKYLEKKYGTEVVHNSGLRVYTTINSDFQKYAEESLEQGLLNLESQIKPINIDRDSVESTIKLQGVVVSIDVNNGAVRAMVGGRNFFDTPFNRAINNNRQPGSGFKPFLYYSAFYNLGISPSNVFFDRIAPISIDASKIWEPRNFGEKYDGPIIIKKAFMDSVNTVAAQLVELLGPKAVVDVAHKCGIRSNLEPVYSVALGTSGVSPYEMASSFSTFASGGIYREPFMIDRIEDVNGRVLERHFDKGIKVLDPVTCYQIVDMMQGVVDSGSAKVIRCKGFDLPAAGKTGTTSSFNDAWFTGFTPLLSTSIWIGYDKSYGMRYKGGLGVTGGRGAAPIWADYMIKVSKIESSGNFEIPRNIEFNRVSSKTGKKVILWSEDTIKVAEVKKDKYIGLSNFKSIRN